MSMRGLPCQRRAILMNKNPSNSCGCSGSNGLPGRHDENRGFAVLGCQLRLLLLSSLVLLRRSGPLLGSQTKLLLGSQTKLLLGSQTRLLLLRVTGERCKMDQQCESTDLKKP